MEDEYKNENEEDDFSPEISPPPLDKNRKIAAGALGVFAFVIIIMWMVQLKSSINSPLNSKNSSADNEATECVGGSCDSNSDEALKAKDTDGDGLSDYDELYIYNTSPYLEDSDSDGFSDKQEIDNDKDPNCPTGRDCYSDPLTSAETEVNMQDSTLDSLLEQYDYSETDESYLDSAESFDFEELFGSSMNADDLRQMLIQAGMDEEMLNQISDEELMASYAEILGE